MAQTSEARGGLGSVVRAQGRMVHFRSGPGRGEQLLGIKSIVILFLLYFLWALTFLIVLFDFWKPERIMFS